MTRKPRLRQMLSSKEDQDVLAGLVEKYGVAQVLVALGFIQREEKRLDQLGDLEFSN